MKSLFQKAVTLDAAQQVKVDDDVIKIDPQLLFQRLSAAAQRFIDDIPDVFRYELCGVPASLFDSSGLIRKAQKSLLADAIWSLGNCSSETFVLEKCVPVIDGGSLIHHIPWKSRILFSEICDAYLNYILFNFPNAVIVFDGYKSGPTTKDTAHVRRTHGVTGSKVYFSKATPFVSKKDRFLGNPDNKQNFIFMLGEVLEENGYSVKHAKGDADVLIVLTALELAETKDVVVIGEDTDLLVLLLHRANRSHKNIYFKSAAKQRSSKGLRLWNIHETRHILGENQCTVLPVIHALSGCDTTSQMFGISKAAVLKKFQSDDNLIGLAKNFLTDANQQEIVVCGEHIIVILYGGLPVEGLDLLRFRKFTSKVMNTTSQVQVQSLPPTSSAAKYHSMRVFYQVHEWLNDKTYMPTEWGWKLSNNRLIPVKCDFKAAPDKLLNMVRCKCKQNCDSKRCTCRKNGLECSPGCAECRGISCSNTTRCYESESETDSD